MHSRSQHSIHHTFIVCGRARLRAERLRRRRRLAAARLPLQRPLPRTCSRPRAGPRTRSPGNVFALTASNRLVSFNRDTPGTIITNVQITGLMAGESVLGIDVRPADRLLYALGSSGRIYTINAASGAATLKSTLAADPTDATMPFGALAGTDFAVDFNPVPDRLRVVSNTGLNLRINVDTGATITDGNINGGAAAAAVSGAAYTQCLRRRRHHHAVRHRQRHRHAVHAEPAERRHAGLAGHARRRCEQRERLRHRRPEQRCIRRAHCRRHRRAVPHQPGGRVERRHAGRHDRRRRADPRPRAGTDRGADGVRCHRGQPAGRVSRRPRRTCSLSNVAITGLDGRRKRARHRRAPGGRPAVRHHQRGAHRHARPGQRGGDAEVDARRRRRRHDDAVHRAAPAPRSASTSIRSPIACASSATTDRTCASTSTAGPRPPTAPSTAPAGRRSSAPAPTPTASAAPPPPCCSTSTRWATCCRARIRRTTAR